MVIIIIIIIIIKCASHKCLHQHHHHFHCRHHHLHNLPYSQSLLSDSGRRDRPQQWAPLNQPSNPVQWIPQCKWTTVDCISLHSAQWLGVNLIGIPGSLAWRTSVSPLSSKAPTRNTRTKFKRNTTTQEGRIHKYQNTGRWKTEIQNIKRNMCIVRWRISLPPIESISHSTLIYSPERGIVEI